MNLFNSKGFSNIITIILILAVVVIGGGVFWIISQQSQTNQNTNTNAVNINTTANQNLNVAANQNANENTNAASNQNTNALLNQNANVAANTNTTDETADWKTYRNEKYGFEVKYPEDFHVSELPNLISILNYEPTSPEIPDISLPEAPLYKVEIVIFQNLKNSDLEEWVDEYIKNSESQITIFERKQIVVDDELGIWTIQQLDSRTTRTVVVYVEQGDFIYLLNAGKAETPFSITFNNIVNSFNFIN